MTHLTYNPIEYDNTSLPPITIIEDDSLSVRGSLAHKTITVQAPFDVIFYYTLDGSEPATSAYLYTNPITIETSSTLGDIVSARILCQNLKTLETSECAVITAVVSPVPLILGFNTNNAGSANDTFILPLLKQADDPTVSYDFNYEVKQGDSVIQSGTHTTDADLTISGLTAGVYSIEISAYDGNFGCVQFNNSGDKDKVTELNQWGTVQWNNQLGELDSFSAFYGCINLELTATDKPNFNCRSLRGLFWNCSNLAGVDGILDISEYDFSNAFTLRDSIRGITSATSVDASNVKFCVGGTEVSQGGMRSCFRDLTNVTTIDLTGADTSGTISITTLFYNAPNLTSIVGLADLDLSNCRFFDSAFRTFSGGVPLPYDVDMSNWNIDVSGELFDTMFYNRTFDGSHYVSGIENITPANLINQPFKNFMIGGSRLTTASYDALLIKLASYIGNYTITRGPLSMGGSQYTGGGAAEAARDALVLDGWTIQDGGSV